MTSPAYQMCCACMWSTNCKYVLVVLMVWENWCFQQHNCSLCWCYVCANKKHLRNIIWISTQGNFCTLHCDCLLESRHFFLLGFCFAMVFSVEKKVKEGWVISFHYSETGGMAEIINSFPMTEIILFIVLLPGNIHLS